MTVKLYIADCGSLSVPDALEQVTNERRMKALRLSGEDKRRQSLGAAILLYRVLNGGVPFDFSVTENGKPYCENMPCFSISHSGSMVLCAVCDNEIGADIQLQKKARSGVAERFFTASEYEEVRRSHDPDEAFTRIWAMKESYVKALGLGLSCPLDSFTASERIGEYSLKHQKRGDYHIAVCVRGEDIGDIELHEEIL